MGRGEAAFRSSSRIDAGRTAPRRRSGLTGNYVRFEELGEGLGDRFYRTIDYVLERIRQFPQIAPVYEGPYRRLVVRAFGYGIFYTVEGERVMVGAILDLRQDPDSIRSRLLS